MKKGYAIQVTSWENDGDNYNTVTMDDLPKEDVSVIIAFCKLFDSGSNNKSGLGNTDDHDAVYLAIKTFGEENPKYAEYDLHYDLGLGGSEWYASRVFESIKVLYIPVDIEDVTKEFV